MVVGRKAKGRNLNYLITDYYKAMKKIFLISSFLSLVLSINFAFAIGDDLRESCFKLMGGTNAPYSMMGNYNMMTWSGMGGGWGIIGLIFAIALWVAFWAIVIVAIVALVRWLYMRIFKGELWIFGRKETPEEILKLRYAKGEITKEQYESMKREISK